MVLESNGDSVGDLRCWCSRVTVMMSESNLRSASGRLGHGFGSRICSQAGSHLKTTVLCVITIRVLQDTNNIRKNAFAQFPLLNRG
jgi:hypothetical protein